MIPKTKKVTAMVFEEHVVTHEKWHRSYPWQMTLRLGLSEPPCVLVLRSQVIKSLIGPESCFFAFSFQHTIGQLSESVM